MPPLVVIVGPTASGKSALALRLAERVGGEILSADSQQVYRGMDIGTGKVSAEERARVRHHLIDVADPDEEMTAARFLDLADAAIADMAARGAPVIACGGTMLYVRVLLYGLFRGPGADASIRARLEAEAEASGVEALRRQLDEVDPALARSIERNDKRRLIRALEVYELTGVPLSEFQRRHNFDELKPRYPAALVGLAPEREALYARIGSRVDAMFAGGLVEEVAALRTAGYGPSLRSQQAIGYAEVHRYLDGGLELGPCVDLTKRNSRRYARRQLSWYRRDAKIDWHPDPDSIDLLPLERYLRAC